MGHVLPRSNNATDHMVRYLAPLFSVAIRDVEVMLGQEYVNMQLRIRSPKMLQAVFAAPYP